MPSKLKNWKKIESLLIFFYIFSFVSNRIARSTFKRDDQLLRNFQFYLYLTAVFGSVMLYILFMGAPIEGEIFSNSSDVEDNNIFKWPPRLVQFLAATTASIFIWFLAFALCYLSRISELIQMERRVG